MSATQLWKHIHEERARLLAVLDDLEPHQWQAASSCAQWSVEDVVAHLSAAANTGTWAWIRSILRARFNADQHNQRLLSRYRGTNPEQTLDIYRRSVASTIAPTKDLPAYLGEVIVHGQDIARPLHVSLTPDPVAVLEVAPFHVVKDFAVNSSRLVRGLRLEADDADFDAGDGPLVRGALLDLVMAMAGRSESVASLGGDGVAELRQRLSAGH